MKVITIKMLFLFVLEIPVRLSVAETGLVSKPETLQALGAELSGHINQLNSHLKEKKVSCVTVTRISAQKDVLVFGVRVQTLKDLETLKKICGKAVLSQIITDFSYKERIDIKVKLKLFSKLLYRFVLDETTYKNAKSVFEIENQQELK